VKLVDGGAGGAVAVGNGNNEVVGGGTFSVVNP
jgi:hypothetical protein